MNTERMKHLITVMERVRDARLAFNLESWVDTYDKNDGGAFMVVNADEPCGTACCAMGYAALDPEFQEQGLGLENSRGVKIDSIATFNKNRHSWAQPVYRGEHGIDAAAVFLGITYEAACWLFTPEEYLSYEDWRVNEDGYEAVGPEQVIARIEHLLAGGSFELHKNRKDRESSEEEAI